MRDIELESPEGKAIVEAITMGFGRVSGYSEFAGAAEYKFHYCDERYLIQETYEAISRIMQE